MTDTNPQTQEAVERVLYAANPRDAVRKDAIEQSITAELAAIARVAREEERKEHDQIGERDGGWETWRLCGHIQKNDGGVFTDAEADALIDDFLEWVESKDLGYGGSLSVPSRNQPAADPMTNTDPEGGV